jgi:PPP family 3-phenylpropionic acid transporter
LSNHKQILFLKGIHFLHIGGKAVVLPFLPLFLIYQQFSSVEIGMIMGIAPLISIVAQPVVGFLSDKYKTIKKILILLYVCVFATSFGIFFSDQFGVVFISVILMHFALSPCTPLIDSMTIKSLGTEKHEYGKIRLWGSVGFGLIAVISGPLLQWWGIEKIFILFWFVILFTLFYFTFLKDQNQSSETVNFKSVAQVFKNRGFIGFIFLCLIVMIPHRINDTMIVLHLERLGGTEFMIGLAWALAAISEVPVFYFLSKKLKEYKDIVLLGVVAVFYSLRWILYSLIDSAWMITILQLSQGLTFGLFWLVAMQMAVRVVPEQLRSTGQSVLASVCFGIGGAIGGTGGGWVFDHWGSSIMYQLMAAITLFAVLLIFLSHVYIQRRIHPRQHRQHLS